MFPQVLQDFPKWSLSGVFPIFLKALKVVMKLLSKLLTARSRQIDFDGVSPKGLTENYSSCICELTGSEGYRCWPYSCCTYCHGKTVWSMCDLQAHVWGWWIPVARLVCSIWDVCLSFLDYYRGTYLRFPVNSTVNHRVGCVKLDFGNDIVVCLMYV